MCGRGRFHRESSMGTTWRMIERTRSGAYTGVKRAPLPSLQNPADARRPSPPRDSGQELPKFTQGCPQSKPPSERDPGTVSGRAPANPQASVFHRGQTPDTSSPRSGKPGTSWRRTRVGPLSQGTTLLQRTERLCRGRRRLASPLPMLSRWASGSTSPRCGQSTGRQH